MRINPCVMGPSMSRRAALRRRAGFVTTLAGIAGLSRTAHADPRTDYMVKQLASDDFRVRTQAALALGASRDAAAAKPLCGALNDSNAAVKLAVVAALGKLGNAQGVGCLKTARGSSDAATQKAIDQALEKISLGGDPPPPGAGAKWYVAIQVTNKTGRPNLEIEGIVRKAMQDKLLANTACAVAPRSETTAQAKDIVKNKKLTGYLLMASGEPYNYAGGNLTVQVKVTMWTYPDKALKAEFQPKLTQQGTSKGDTESENLLMGMGAETAVQSFNKVAASL